MQVLFGLRPGERLVASAACWLGAPPLVVTPAAAGAAAAAAAAAGGASSGISSTPSTAAAAAAAAGLTAGDVYGLLSYGSRSEGCLYCTARVLAFSTLLAGDARGATDVTFKIWLKDVREVSRGDSPDRLLVATAAGELFQFQGFAFGERDRICALLNGDPGVVSTPPHVLAASSNGGAVSGGGGGSKQSSPRVSAAGSGGPAGRTAAAAASGGGGGSGGGSATPPGVPPGLPRPPGRTGSFGPNSSAAAATAAAIREAFGSSAAVAGTPPSLLSAAADKAAATVSSSTPAGRKAGRNVAAALAAAEASVVSAAATAAAAAGRGGTGIAAANEVAATIHRAVATAAAATAATAAASNPRAAESGALPLLSTPCFLVSVLRNKEGMLHLYGTRLDFACPSDPGVGRSIPLTSINNVSQRPAGWGEGSGSVLALTVEGDRAPVVFGGIGDALLASLKANISELCFACG
ncbi:hypothetical protein Agub_g13833 [Astrephomene gubernaculifera]|uniref:Uncharacterized protein n=1 Tax=Astrephomene gubernaculifera TaxID=47775 RepID=A0AAD3HSW5_9CHLO|nr:hypothetical protein Agub_g13833 [Astrephomene gubernaculifera]